MYHANRPYRACLRQVLLRKINDWFTSQDLFELGLSELTLRRHGAPARPKFHYRNIRNIRFDSYRALLMPGCAFQCRARIVEASTFSICETRSCLYRWLLQHQENSVRTDSTALTALLQDKPVHRCKCIELKDFAKNKLQQHLLPDSVSIVVHRPL